jgi:hypothetical protein
MDNQTGTVMGLALALDVNSFSDFNDYVVDAFVPGNGESVLVAGTTEDGYVLVVGAPGAVLLMVPLPMYIFGVSCVVGAVHHLLGEKRGRAAYLKYRVRELTHALGVPRPSYTTITKVFKNGADDRLFDHKIKAWKKRCRHNFDRPRSVFTSIELPASLINSLK